MAKGLSSTLRVLMFTDIVGSVECKKRLGDTVYARLAVRHDELFRSVIASTPGAIIHTDTGDGFYVEFPTPRDAVLAALRFQYGLKTPDWSPEPLRVRVGIHVGTVTEMHEEGEAGSTRSKHISLTTDMAARLMGLAAGGQVLLTRAAFDDARQYVREHPPLDGLAAPDTPPPKLEWMAHGRYLMKGNEEALEVFEVGAAGLAPLCAPADSEKARREVTEDERRTLGWRAAAGLEIPRRKRWVVDRKLGEGGFGEVWLGRHVQTNALRVFKFCFDAVRLRSFERELALFSILQKSLGKRPDIAEIYEVQLEQAPFFLEGEFSELGDLVDWSQRKGGLAAVPLARRVDIAARVAEAVAAAHSVGILHKDIKPQNILMREAEDGCPRPVLSDFGIGAVADASMLGDLDDGTRQTAKTLTDDGSSGPSTPMYAPPEMQASKPFTVQGDWYALGVLLYQLVAADLKKPLAAGWERDVPDELLREDIAACVDGDPSRRMSASHLARNLKGLEQRRREREEQAQAERKRADKAESLKRKLAKRKAMFRLAMVAGAAVTAVLLVVLFELIQERSLKQKALDAQRQAEAAEELALRRQAEGLVLQGDALVLADQDVEARRLYDEALQQFDKLKLPLFGPELATWGLDAAAGWPVATWEGTGRDPAGGRLPLRVVVASPDGRRFVAAGDDKTFHLRSAVTGTRIRPFEGHARPVTTIAFSRDGQTIVSGSQDLSIRAWDVATGKPKPGYATIAAAHELGIGVVVLSPDGLRIVSAGWDRTLKIWDARNGKLLQSFGGGEEEPFIRCLALSPDGQTLACGTNEAVRTATPSTQPATTGSADASPARPAFPAGPTPAGDVRVYEANAAGEFSLARTLPGHSIGVAGVAFCPADYQPAGAPEAGATFSPAPQARRRLATAGSDGAIRLWDAGTGELLRTYAGHRAAVDGVAFSPDGRLLLSASWDRTLKLWAVESEQPLRTFSGHTNWAHSVAFCGDGLRALSASEDGTVRLWSVQGGRETRDLKGHGGPVSAVAFSPDGRRALTASADHTLRLWDVAGGQTLLTFAGHKNWVFCAAFSPDGARLVSGSGDGTLKVWDARTAKELFTLTGHAGSVLCCAYSPDGKRIVSGSRDQTVRTWDAATGSPGLTFAAAAAPAAAAGAKSHAGAVTCVAFSPDGNQVLSGSLDKSLQLWDAKTGARVRTLGPAGGHTEYVTAAAFGPDGRLAYSSSGDGLLKCWDVRSGAVLRTFTPRDGRTGPVDCLALSPDGKWVVSGRGRAVRFWDAGSGEEVRTLPGPADAVAAVAFAPDSGKGARLLTACWDHSARVWDFGRPARERDMAPKVEEAWRSLATASPESADPAALATVGQWFAFRGLSDWATELLARARDAGAAVQAHTLARCYWDAGRLEAARDALQQAAGEATSADEKRHDQLCLDALAARIAGGAGVAAPGVPGAPETLVGGDDPSWDEPRPAGDVPVRFSIRVPLNPPGRRDWSELDAGTWEERWPDGNVRRYKVIDRLAGRPEDGGRRGTLVSPPNVRNFQLLIPDCGTTADIEYRGTDAQPGQPARWKKWARLHVIDSRPGGGGDGKVTR